MIFRARTLVDMVSAPVDDGAVAIRGQKITAAGRYAEIHREHPGPVTDLGEQVLMPGLVNSHCHLDYSMMRRTILPQRNFSQWIQRINALKAQLTDADYVAAIATGFHEAVATGTTSLINIAALPEVMLELPPPPIHTWWCLELLDIRNRNFSDEMLMGMLRFFDPSEPWLGGFGLSPHAPYTASLPLYRLARTSSELHGGIFTTHVAESRDEFQMFYDASGPLYDALAGLGRNMDDCGHDSPLALLIKSGALPPRSLLVHVNELGTDDLDLLSRCQANLQLSVAHCPQSHRYFSHAPFRYEDLRDIGINICLGTDSLASSPSLNMFDEMRTMAQAMPTIDPKEIVAAATVNGASAIPVPEHTATLTPGAVADLIAIPCAPSINDTYDTIVHNLDPVSLVVVQGKEIHSRTNAETRIT